MWVTHLWFEGDAMEGKLRILSCVAHFGFTCGFKGRGTGLEGLMQRGAADEMLFLGGINDWVACGCLSSTGLMLAGVGLVHSALVGKKCNPLALLKFSGILSLQWVFSMSCYRQVYQRRAN